LQLLNFIIPQSCNLSIFQSCNLSSINNTILLRQTRTPINRLLYIVFFTFLFTLFSFSYGQVKIKEKVEIKPGSGFLVIKNLSKNSTATIEVIANWTRKCGPEIVTAKVDLWKEGSNDVLATSSSTGTPVTVSTTVSEEGNYLANIDFTNPQGHYNCADITWQFLVDGKQQGENETCNSCGSSSISRYVKFSECREDAPECDGEQKMPEINAENEGPIYSLCDKQRSDGILRGEFSKSWNWPYKPINVLACFNKQTNKWQYEISENKIILKYNLTICYENLNSLYPNLIGNLNDLYTIPKNDFCLAVRNFEKQYKYGGGRGNTYYIVEATVKHEERHRDDYLRMLNKLKNEFDLPNKIVEYNPDCNEIDNYNDALQKGAENIRDKLRNFIRKFKDKWTEWKDSFSSYEQYTQDRIHSIIDEYIRQLESIYNLKREDCK